MGGGGSSIKVTYDLQSVTVQQAIFKDAYITPLIQLSEKNVALDKFDDQLLKHGVTKEDLLGFQKLKFAKIGFMQKLQFVLQKSFFKGKMMQISSVRKQGNVFDINLSVFNISLAYTVPMKTLVYKSPYQTRKFMVAVPELSIQTQQKIANNVKLMVSGFDTKIFQDNKKRLTPIDMLGRKFLQILHFTKKEWLVDIFKSVGNPNGDLSIYYEFKYNDYIYFDISNYPNDRNIQNPMSVYSHFEYIMCIKYLILAINNDQPFYTFAIKEGWKNLMNALTKINLSQLEKKETFTKSWFTFWNSCLSAFANDVKPLIKPFDEKIAVITKGKNWMTINCFQVKALFADLSKDAKIGQNLEKKGLWFWREQLRSWERAKLYRTYFTDYSQIIQMNNIYGKTYQSIICDRDTVVSLLTNLVVMYQIRPK